MKYRISFDVEANSARDAFEKLGPVGGSYGSNIEINPFTVEEEGIVLELARTSLKDEEIYNYIAEELDLSYEVLDELLEKLRKRC